MAQSRRPMQRSDEIRLRRSRQTRQLKRKLKRGGRKVARHTPAPVMARSRWTLAERQDGGRRESKTARKTRRRFDVTLDARGAEMRLPTLPQVRLGWRFISFAFVAFLGSVLYHFWNSPAYRVDAAEVTGLRLLTSSEVNAGLGITGKHIFDLDATAMEQHLLDEFQEFSSVSVNVELPQTVLITVTERIPVLVWYQEESPKLVDAEGLIFPLRDEALLSAYPVIEAAGDPPALVAAEPPSPSLEMPSLERLTEELSLDQPASKEAQPLLSPEMVETILYMFKQAPPDVRLVYDPVHGLGWKDSRGWVVYCGDMQDFEMKLRVYEAILQHLKEANTRPTMISVEYVHAPYFRLEQ